MKRYSIPVFLCFALSLCAGIANADTKSESPGETPLKPGAWAFQFRITNNFTLSSFDGSIVGVKRHLSDRSAIRAGLSMRVDTDDAASRDRYVSDDTVRSDVVGERDVNAIDLELALAYLYYVRTDDRITPFVGLGPLFRYDRDTEKTENRPYDFTSTTERKSSVFTFGVRSTLGVECFVSDRFGVHAEYRASVSYVHTKSEHTKRNSLDASYLSTDDYHAHAWRIRGDSVVFGLSAYF